MSVWLRGVDGDPRQQARQLLMDVAVATLGVPRSEIRLTNEPGGRPLMWIGDESTVHVGLSHTRGLVAAALSSLGPVGVDVELVRDVPALALARRWLAPAEVEWLAQIGADQQSRQFLSLWTQKEAVGKALGLGLRQGGTKRLMPRGDAVVTEPAVVAELTVVTVPTVGAEPAASDQATVAILRRVPGLDRVAVASWAAGADYLVALACDAVTQRPTTIRICDERESRLS